MAWEVEDTHDFEAWWEALTADDRWYDTFVPIADRLYDAHLDALRREGLIDG
jgi:hypothetical protein